MVELASCHVPSAVCLCLLGGEVSSDLGRCLQPERLPNHKSWLKIVSEEE